MKLIHKRITMLCMIVSILCMAFSQRNLVQAATTSYDVNKGNVVISKSGNYKVTGQSKNHTIRIKKGAKVNLWLTNVTISSGSDTNPITVEEGATLNLILKGKNEVAAEKVSVVNEKKGIGHGI